MTELREGSMKTGHRQKDIAYVKDGNAQIQKLRTKKADFWKEAARLRGGRSEGRGTIDRGFR